MHRHTTRLSCTDLPGGRPAEDPGAPPLTVVCVSPSPQQPPGSGAAKNNKNSEATRQDGKLLAANVKTTCRKTLHLAGTPQLGKLPQNGPNTETARKSTKSRKNKTTRARSNGSSSQQEDELHKRRDQEREPTQDKHEAFHGRRRERADPAGQQTTTPQQEANEQEATRTSRRAGRRRTAGRQTPRPQVPQGE